MIGERDRLLDVAHREHMARLAAEAKAQEAVAEAAALAERARAALAQYPDLTRERYASTDQPTRPDPTYHGDLSHEQVVAQAKALLELLPTEPPLVTAGRRGELSAAINEYRDYRRTA